jgi:hypothetical protein
MYPVVYFLIVGVRVPHLLTELNISRAEVSHHHQLLGVVLSEQTIVQFFYPTRRHGFRSLYPARFRPLVRSLPKSLG